VSRSARGSLEALADAWRRLAGWLTPTRVALWMEERAPSLQFALVAAVEGSDPTGWCAAQVRAVDVATPGWRALRRALAWPLAAAALGAVAWLVAPRLATTMASRASRRVPAAPTTGPLHALRARLVDVGYGTAAEFDAAGDVQGKIVLARRDDNLQGWFTTMGEEAALRGAAAIVNYGYYGNVVDPDDMIAKYGSDALRTYVMFVAPPEKEVEWSDAGLEGSFRFLVRVWRVVDHWKRSVRSAVVATGSQDLTPAERAVRRKTHETIARVTADIEERMHLNTAISALMELVNELYAFSEGTTAGAPGRHEAEPTPGERPPRSHPRRRSPKSRSA